MTTEFEPFRKLARLSRNCQVTEKIDGTNAQIFIAPIEPFQVTDGCLSARDGHGIWVGSRNRYITPQDDNFGFAKWVQENAEVLLRLGPGRHFGEWWGNGIQRGYGLKEKRFSLFNVKRWGFLSELTADQNPLAGIVRVVPVIYEGLFDISEIDRALESLRIGGSVAAPGFFDPEGIVVYHTAADLCFKKTIKGDDKPKSLA